MRIVHLVESTIAGVRRHIEALTLGLDAREFQQVVGCPLVRHNAYGDVGFVETMRRAGVPVVPIAMQRPIRPRQDALALAQMVRLLRQNRFDLIHTHSSKAGFLGRLAARISGQRPAIYTPHGLFFLGLPPSRKRRFYIALERFAARLGGVVIAVSADEHAALLKFRIAPAEKLVLIENGVMLPRLPAGYNRQQVRAELGQHTSGPLIGTLARLADQKHPLLFLEAAAQVYQQRPDVRFVWCGSGELLDMARQRASELGIAEVCLFTGHREDTASILGALDVFWLTSRYEGLPSALLEALALRLPAVTTSVVGTREVLTGGAGILVPPDDAPALAQATLALVQDAVQMAHLGELAARRFAAIGTADRLIARTGRLYQRVAGDTEGERADAITRNNEY